MNIQLIYIAPPKTFRFTRSVSGSLHQCRVLACGKNQWSVPIRYHQIGLEERTYAYSACQKFCVAFRL